MFVPFLSLVQGEVTLLDGTFCLLKHNVSYPFPKKKLHMQINETKEAFKMLTW